MPIRLIDLIAKVPAEVEGQVRRARDQSRSFLQDALRAECRLVMRTPEEAEEKRAGAQVPVDIAPGHPAILKEIEFADDLEIVLLLGRYRANLGQVRTGARGLIQLREQLAQRPNPEKWIGVAVAELRSSADWATSLLKILDQHDPLKAVLGVRTDYLGVYEYDARELFADEYAVNKATIRLYWGVIGLVADWMGCTVEELTVVVLAHELAHAYTQLGADIEGRRWPAIQFSQAEGALTEGLAQYYTDRVLRRLERRYAGALKAYESMLPGQPVIYRTHLPWVKGFSPEAVRRAMLEVRRWGEGTVATFNERLQGAQAGLHPEKREQ